MTTEQLPTTVEGITPEWITGVLRAGGHIPGDASVAAVEAERIGEHIGFVGLLARIKLRYDGGVEGPRQIVAKLQSPDAGARMLAQAYGLYEREAKFYGELAPTVGIATPRCYYAEYGPGGYALLLEDLSLVSRPGDQVAGATLEESLLVVRELARMHAAWWDSERLASVGWLQSGTDLVRQPLSTIYPLVLPQFEAKYGERLKPHIRELLPTMNQRLLAVMDDLDQRPMTLTHGDFRLDNMFFGHEGAPFELAVCDWQSPNKAYGVFDIAYYVITNESVGDRRKHEMELLRAYHDELQAQGARDLPFETLYEDYCASPLAMLALGVINGAMLDAGQGPRAVELFEAVFDRFLTAFDDLDALSRLPA